jgi:hypothetical protein
MVSVAVAQLATTPARRPDYWRVDRLRLGRAAVRAGGARAHPSLLREEGGQIGGVGLKIQPDRRYMNLYHWLLGDDYYRRGNSGVGLPRPNFIYAESPDVP